MSIRQSLLTLSLAFGLLLSALHPALAACTDPPSPGVNWQRCLMDRLEYQNEDFSEARLRDASFIRADLSGSKLVKAYAFRAKFVSAKLQGVDFTDATLSEADFTKANLTGAVFVDADLRRARLYRSDLSGADLTGARLTGADLTQTDLSGATWTDGKRVCAKGSIGRCH